jgi:16S rRNA (guanine966-N2)-methyltransferase
MNILRDQLTGARVLDLYAGSGALGLEALSRGAASVTFVECGAKALKALRANIAQLGVDGQVSIHRGDSLNFVKHLGPDAYDVVLADPPYGEAIATGLVRLYRQVPFARILSVEHPGGEKPGGDETRPYGSTALTFCYAR